MPLSELLAQLFAETFALTVQKLAETADVWGPAVRRAMQATAEDSKPDPQLTDALRKEQSAAIAAGELPPAGVR